jgi:hypothetical protein
VSQIAAFTPAAAECVVDTTNNRICVGDRTTAGGEDQRGAGRSRPQCVFSQRTALTTPVNFLHLAANSTALQIASSSLYGGTGKPLTFLYGSMEICRLNSVGLGVSVGGNAFASPFTVSTTRPRCPRGLEQRPRSRSSAASMAARHAC